MIVVVVVVVVGVVVVVVRAAIAEHYKSIYIFLRLQDYLLIPPPKQFVLFTCPRRMHYPLETSLGQLNRLVFNKVF